MPRPSTARAGRIVRHARTARGASAAEVAGRIADLRPRRGFRLDEARTIGLLDPGRSTRM